MDEGSIATFTKLFEKTPKEIWQMSECRIQIKGHVSLAVAQMRTEVISKGFMDAMKFELGI